MARRDFDVIVIGAGGAGFSAAIEASARGAKTLLVEAADKPGGTTGKSTSVFYAAGTAVQRARGIKDDAEAMYRYYLHINQMRVEPALARKLCERSAEDLAWLEAMGVVFPPEELYQSCVDFAPRGHKPKGWGAAVIDTLNKVYGARDNTELRLGTRVQELLLDGNAVVGVRVAGKELRAGAVVIASGGFGHDPALLAQYYPTVARNNDWVWSISAPDCRGDGIRMGKQVGASIQGYDLGLVGSTPNFAHFPDRYRPYTPVYVNREGRRFVNEAMARYLLHTVMRKQTGGDCFVVFDEATRLEMLEQQPGETRTSIVPAGYFPDEKNYWTADGIKEMVAAGKVLKRDSLEELGAALGIYQPKALANGVARFNADVARGEDREFFKAAPHLRTVRKGPFYGAPLKLAIVEMTFAGLRINSDAEVLSEVETSIPGLYAAGEATGNVLGEQYIGGGISIANAVIYGRVAGASAAGFARA